jgi:hypothetical protein
MVDVVRGTPLVPVAAILVSVREIEYANGVKWQAPDVPRLGEHALVPAASFDPVTSGAPTIDTRGPASSPVEVTDPFELVSHVTQLNTPLFRAPMFDAARQWCASFVGHDPRTVKRVHFAVALEDGSGAPIVTQFFETRGTFESGVAYRDLRGSPMNCTSLRNVRWQADTFYARPMAGGADVPVGRVRITPDAVDFADGTSWTAPKP